MNLLLHSKPQKEKDKIRSRLGELLQDHKEVIFAYVYGSFAEEGTFHDIDLGIFVSGISEKDSINYMLDLAQRLSAEVRLPVDVRVLNFAPVTFLYHVIQGDLVADNDEEIRSGFIEGVMRKYLDLKARIRMAIKEAFAS
jgi:hypothetical protein